VIAAGTTFSLGVCILYKGERGLIENQFTTEINENKDSEASLQDFLQLREQTVERPKQTQDNSKNNNTRTITKECGVTQASKRKVRGNKEARRRKRGRDEEEETRTREKEARRRRGNAEKMKR
jgi:hypothetical protein